MNAMKEYLEDIGKGTRRDSVIKVTHLSCVSWYLVSRCSVKATRLRSASVWIKKGFQLLTDADTEIHSRIHETSISGSVCEWLPASCSDLKAIKWWSWRQLFMWYLFTHQDYFSHSYLIGEIQGLLKHGVVIDKLGRPIGIVLTTCFLILGMKGNTRCNLDSLYR